MNFISQNTGQIK